MEIEILLMQAKDEAGFTFSFDETIELRPYSEVTFTVIAPENADSPMGIERELKTGYFASVGEEGDYCQLELMYDVNKNDELPTLSHEECCLLLCGLLEAELITVGEISDFEAILSMTV
jgi:hypothetical protein